MGWYVFDVLDNGYAYYLNGVHCQRNTTQIQEKDVSH